MTVIIVPTLLLWILIALCALNAVASIYSMWLRRKLDAKHGILRDAFFKDGRDGGM